LLVDRITVYERGNTIGQSEQLQFGTADMFGDSVTQLRRRYVVLAALMIHVCCSLTTASGVNDRHGGMQAIQMQHSSQVRQLLLRLSVCLSVRSHT